MTQVEQYKVVQTDNYDRETRAEVLVQEHMTLEDAKALCERLRNAEDRSDDNWYKVSRQEYVLWRGMAEFVDEE